MSHLSIAIKKLTNRARQNKLLARPVHPRAMISVRCATATV